VNDDWRVFPGGYPQKPGIEPHHKIKSLGKREIAVPGRRAVRQDAVHEHPAQESAQGISPGDPVTGNPGGTEGPPVHTPTVDAAPAATNAPATDEAKAEE
jgi:hypothetical protein